MARRSIFGALLGEIGDILDGTVDILTTNVNPFYEDDEDDYDRPHRRQPERRCRDYDYDDYDYDDRPHFPW